MDGSARGADFYVATREDISLAVRGNLEVATLEDFSIATNTRPGEPHPMKVHHDSGTGSPCLGPQDNRCPHPRHTAVMRLLDS